jgi:iron complex transport system substrate-binding protein
LVGVSHECDFPPVVSSLPVLTRPRYGVPTSADRAGYAAQLASGSQSHSAAVDSAIRAIRLDALSPYLLDQPLLAELRPDVVFTQDLCAVCAPALEEVRSAVRELCGPGTRVVSLTPQRLGEVWDSISAAGEALDRADSARQLRYGLLQRLGQLSARASSAGAPRPTVLTLEWFDPVMNSGLWMAELVDLAGGHELAGYDLASEQPLDARPGDRSRILPPEEIWRLDPDVIILKPCGFKLDRGLAELPALDRLTPWHRWRAVKAGRAYLMDGSAYFNRPGPRLVESAELLAAALHPQLFPELRERYRAEVLQIGPGLEAEPW